MRLCSIILLLSAAASASGRENDTEDGQVRHQQAIVAIKNLGGVVSFESSEPDAPVAVVLTGSSKPTECLPYLKDVRNLRTCDL